MGERKGSQLRQTSESIAWMRLAEEEESAAETNEERDPTKLNNPS